jgi:hypothetical protein
MRIEAYAPVGGLVAVASASEGRLRVVIPPERIFDEAGLDDEIALELIGIPLTGCDLAAIVGQVAPWVSFHPCGGGRVEESGSGAAERRSGSEPPVRPRLSIDVRRPSGARLPEEVRVLRSGGAELAIDLDRFGELRFPAPLPEGFFWEPLPQGAVRAAPPLDLQSGG